MAQALTQHKQSVIFVHLSTSRLLSGEEARSILDLTWQALASWRCTFIRQLNSNLAIPSLGSNFEWQNESADMLTNAIAAFFTESFISGESDEGSSTLRTAFA